MSNMFAITAIGPDRAGLIRDLSEAVSGAGGNIEASRMVALGSEFAVAMLVTGNWHAANRMEEVLAQLGERADLSVTVRPAERRPEGPPAVPYVIDVVALDREGIVLDLSSFFAGRNMEIAELATRRYNAPHTGAAMFAVQMTVNIPADVHLAGLRDEFLDFCDEHNLDAVLEPEQG